MSKETNIGLLGYGKMGKMVESLAAKNNFHISAYFDENNLLDINDAKIIKQLENTSVLIDFSVPTAVVENVEKAAKLKINLVIGTTGWSDKMDQVKNIVEENGIGLIYASNFSMGVNIFFKVTEQAAKLFSAFNAYDPFIEEAHHKMKMDAPSGTAITLKNIVEPYYEQKDIPVASTRVGYIPGTHLIGFDSAFDTIELKHTARNREGFAQGALIAAQWIKDKQGIYEFKDILA